MGSACLAYVTRQLCAAPRVVRMAASQSYGLTSTNIGDISNTTQSPKSRFTTNSKQLPGRPRVAVLYQAVEPPIVNNVRKPMKPGGYRDSGADIAFVLQRSWQVDVITEDSTPAPHVQDGWCFPDTEEGILQAVSRGATHLWANTILFASHPLQTSTSLDNHQDLSIVGQPPLLVEQYDDKNYVNSLLRRTGQFRMPSSWVVKSVNDSVIVRDNLAYPIVGKPIRGRGSHGVKVCHSKDELVQHLRSLLAENPEVMLEEFLFGQEGTVTVMPPSKLRPEYWSMPLVVRFNHSDGIAPYNGVVAVTQNSYVPSEHDLAGPVYQRICDRCEEVAQLLKVTAPIRIDVRQVTDDPNSEFAIFDVNMKPNMTGPGRPGREDQASLTALAAARLGWDYPRLLTEILGTATELGRLRSTRPYSTISAS